MMLENFRLAKVIRLLLRNVGIIYLPCEVVELVAPRDPPGANVGFVKGVRIGGPLRVSLRTRLNVIRMKRRRTLIVRRPIPLVACRLLVTFRLVVLLTFRVAMVVLVSSRLSVRLVSL